MGFKERSPHLYFRLSAPSLRGGALQQPAHVAGLKEHILIGKDDDRGGDHHHDGLHAFGFRGHGDLLLHADQDEHDAQGGAAVADHHEEPPVIPVRQGPGGDAEQ